MSKHYDEHRQQLKEEQAAMGYDEVRDLMKRENQGIFELDKTQSVQHVWVDRGAVMSCEGAGHPNHRAFKIQR